ncbi:MAG: CoA transferase [Syntrophobacterales bacterium]|nr:CoA transferase [Syntrophobacterales bacterium]
MQEEKLPFSGVMVLDLSRLLPGPLCSMLLADFGADVIKIEDPKGGDYIRSWPPFIGKSSGFHFVLNRNKRSLTLNLKDPRGRAIFLKLVRNADVVLESFRPGVMERLGIGYDALRLENPRLIYCAITGYGQRGERAHRAGHDINYLAISGVLSYSGKDGEPILPGVQIGDIGGGALLAAFSIATALYRREKTGRGDFIDISMTDGLLLFHALRWGKFLADGKVPQPGDDMLNHGLACYNIYRTKDGRYMSLGALEPQFWKAFCGAVGHPEWDTPSYFEPGEHQRALIEAISRVFEQKSLEEWIEFFKNIDCCCEPLRNLDEVINDRELEEKGVVVSMIDTYGKLYKELGVVLQCREMGGMIKRGAPELGEHTEEVLQKLGLNSKEIAKLREEGVV